VLTFISVVINHLRTHGVQGDIPHELEEVAAPSVPEYPLLRVPPRCDVIGDTGILYTQGAAMEGSYHGICMIARPDPKE